MPFQFVKDSTIEASAGSHTSVTTKNVGTMTKSATTTGGPRR